MIIVVISITDAVFDLSVVRIECRGNVESGFSRQCRSLFQKQ